MFRAGSTCANGVTLHLMCYDGAIKAEQSECGKEGVKHEALAV